MIFPLFVTLSGVGMAFAYKNRVSHWVTLRRVVVLALLHLVVDVASRLKYLP